MSTTISLLALNNYLPLDSLSPGNLKAIANKLEIFELKEGDAIFNEGDRNDRHIFLYKGSVDLIKAGKILKTIKHNTADAKPAIAHILPRNFSCVASSDAVIFKVDANLLDGMLEWNQTSTFQVDELSNNSNADDWMTRILQTEAFHRIAPANIQEIFTNLEDINVKVGERIIKQGEPGNYFYIIKSGRCMVTQKLPGQDKDVKIADLSSGDTFGEEALISDTTRNSSVVMLSKGVLSRLSKDDFLKLLNKPMIHKLDYTVANLQVKNGDAIWLDVRLPAEYESAHIKGATHMPLIHLRMKIKELDPMVNYILYGDTERRSSSASFILSEKGFKTSILANGIKDASNDDLEGTNIQAG